MSDLEPDRIRSLERELRASLARAAERAPLYRGLRAPAVRRGPRGAVVLGAAAVVVLVAAGVAGLLSARDTNTLAGSCPSVMTFQGSTYQPSEELTRLPTVGHRLGSGRRPVCEDGGGPSHERATSVRAVVGTPSSEAVYVGDTVWTNADLAGLPASLASSRDPVICGSSRTVTAVGQWIGVESSRRVRFDGDVRAPATMKLLTADPAVVPPSFARVLLDVRLTGATVGLARQDVTAMLQGGRAAEVAMRCVDHRFVAISVRRS